MARRTVGKRIVDTDGTVRVHGKASNGEGSLYRDSDGSWRATYTVAGEARRRRVRGRTRDAAIARRAEKLVALGQPQSATLHPDATVAELAGWWLDVVARHRVRMSSFGKYEDRVRRITDTLGATPVRSVTRERVATWQSNLLKFGLAATTVSDVRGTLRQVLEQAVINELIASNPVDRVAAPKVVRSPKRALSSGDARRLVEAASTDRLGAAVALLFVHGWRVSEVLGLAWEDLDLDAGTATVRRAAVYVDGVGVAWGGSVGIVSRHSGSAGVDVRLWSTDVERWRSRCPAEPNRPSSSPLATCCEPTTTRSRTPWARSSTPAPGSPRCVARWMPWRRCSTAMPARSQSCSASIPRRE